MQTISARLDEVRGDSHRYNARRRKSAKISREGESEYLEECGDTKRRESYQACSSFSLLRYAGLCDQPGVVHLSGLALLFVRHRDVAAACGGFCSGCALWKDVCAYGSGPSDPPGDEITLERRFAARPAGAHHGVQREPVGGDAVCERCGIAGTCAEGAG